MRRLMLLVCGSAVIAAACGCSLLTPPPPPAQTAEPVFKPKAVHAAKKPPKPEASQQELADYVRGEMLALSPADGINDNVEVSFDPATSVLSVTQPDGRCDIFLGAIDNNSAIWESYDPSDTYHTRDKILRMTLTSLAGQKARTCYDSHNQVDTSIPANRARLLFSSSKANAVPGFSDKMEKAVKKLVVMAGGTAEKKLF